MTKAGKKLYLMGQKLEIEALSDQNEQVYVDIVGQRFLYSGQIPQAEKKVTQKHWSDFTEDAYVDLLDLALSKYQFIGFDEIGSNENEILWRHDIDFSVHRALRLSKLEKEKGVKATYFFMLNSMFYDFEDADIRVKARQILENGHAAGLHFELPDGIKASSKSDIIVKLQEDKKKLENILGVGLGAVSFHNPDTNGLLDLKDFRIEELINTYAEKIQKQYAYASDSNGYWRFDSIQEVIKNGNHKKLQILTHPAWWTYEPMSPRDRIERCVYGRANSIMKTYDSFLSTNNRENIDK